MNHPRDRADRRKRNFLARDLRDRKYRQPVRPGRKKREFDPDGYGHLEDWMSGTEPNIDQDD